MIEILDQLATHMTQVVVDITVKAITVTEHNN
jgi:hypothetical protein